MTPPRVVAARIRGLFGRESLDQRLDEELRTHLEMLMEENRRRGMTPEEARRAARHEFGGLEQTKESYRDARGIPWLETTLLDARYAARLLRKSPGFTAVVTLILTLGIGATTTVFSIRNSVFSRPLPYPDPERLVLLGEAPVKGGRPGTFDRVRYLDFADWRSQSSVFQDLAAWNTQMANVNLGPEAVRIPLERVSESFFPLLGIASARGRAFAPADFAPGAPSVVMLSHGCWTANFGARPDVVGRTIRVEGRPATIIGVMPARFRSPVLAGSGKFWMPQAPTTGERKRQERFFQVLGRLRPDASLARARAEMATIAGRLERQYPDSNENRGVRVEGMREFFSAAANTNASLLLGVAAVLVLLIACANIANLVLARGIGRRKEIALRMAMGAGKLRLVRQFFVESLLLATAGGAAGLLLAYQATGALSKGAAPLLESIGISRFAIDARVLGFTLALTLGTALLFGLFSLFATSQLHLTRSLNEGSRTVSAGRSKRRLSRGLVAAELTLAVMLLAGAGSILYSLRQFWQLDWGFPIDHRVSVTVALSEGTYPTSEHHLRYFQEAVRKAGSLPGVRSAALASSLPVQEAMAPVLPVKVEGAGTPSGGSGASLTSAACRVVSPDYLRTLSIPLARGRMFDERDRDGAPKVAVVNARLARQLWTGDDPVGRRLEVMGQWWTVVGVAGDVAIFGLFSKPYEILLPYTQAPAGAMTLIAHTAGEPAPMLAAVRDAVRSLDTDQPITDVHTLEGLRDELSRPIAFLASVLILFGASALLLATAGICGVVSHSVSTRTREIGIRMALGAERSRVLSQVLGEGVRMTGIGVCFGAGGAFLLMRVLINRVWWFTPPGLEVLVPIAVLLAAVALAGSYIPAWRASRIDPVATLRNE